MSFGRFLTAVLILISFTVPLMGYSPEAEALIMRRELVIALDRQDVNFNIHEAWSIEMAQVLNALAEGLFSYHPVTMEPIPAMATSVESIDSNTWVIRLREGIRFSNGDPITAETFRNSWLHLIAPGMNHPYASMLDIVTGARSYRTGRGSGDPSTVGIDVLDSRTLKLSLVTPAPYLLNILCHHSFSPVHPENLGNMNQDTPKGLISSGPFMVESITPQEILLTENPYYWDAQSLELRNVRIRFYESQWQLVSDFQSGLVHWSLRYINPALLLDGDLVIGYPEYSTGFYYFSAIEGPYADPRVRQALAHLIPWEQIRSPEVFFVPAGSLVPQTAQYYGAEAVSRRNTATAERLLSSAGFPGGEGLPPLSIAVYPGSLIEKITNMLADTWRESLGITVTVDVRPYLEYSSEEARGKYDISFMSWVGDFYDPYSFLALWHSDSSLNLGGQYNPIYDSMVDRALREHDTRKRYQLLRDAEQYLLTQGTVMPLFHGVSINLLHSSIIGGWSPNLLDIHPIKHIYFRDLPSLQEGIRL